MLVNHITLDEDMDIYKTVALQIWKKSIQQFAQNICRKKATLSIEWKKGPSSSQ